MENVLQATEARQVGSALVATAITNSSTPASVVGGLSAVHLADLRKSGLSDEQIAACGFKTLTSHGAINCVLKWRGGAEHLGDCLLIPYRRPDGSLIPSQEYARLKPNRPRIGQTSNGEPGKPVKYEAPKGSSVRLYIPPASWRALSDPSVRLLITEGEKKAAKADQEGFCCLGLSGVEAWSKRREIGPDGRKVGERELLDDFEHIVLRGREVFIAFDSDLAEKPAVQRAEWALSQALKQRGADVRAIRLPDGPAVNGIAQKVGLDDFLVTHSPDELGALLSVAIEPQKPASDDSPVPDLVLNPMVLSEFMATDFPQHYLVKDILIAEQLAVVGAPKKSLKTSVCCDLAFSLTTATPFLGRFHVPKPVKVLLLSAESGPAKLQRTFRLVAAAREMRPESEQLAIEFNAVPQLACQEHLRLLAEKIIELRSEVVILDPLYLMLLGGSDRPINPADMFQMGMLLKAVDEAVRRTGATLILVHHATKAAGRKFEPLDLDDLSQAGIAAFARQWMLLSPKAKFDTATGTHELFFEVGGSAGHFGSYAMTVVEGRVDDPINGKRWHVLLKDASEARETDRRDKEHRNDVETHNRTMQDVERLAEELRKEPNGLTKTKLKDRTGWNAPRCGKAIALAYEKRIIEDIAVKAANGQTYEGFRLRTPATSHATSDTRQLEFSNYHSDTRTHSDIHSNFPECSTH